MGVQSNIGDMFRHFTQTEPSHSMLGFHKKIIRSPKRTEQKHMVVLGHT